MAKSSSPVRLQRELMDAAALNGKRNHRSAAQQVEYWASIGRSVNNMVDPESLLSVISGLAKVTVESNRNVTIQSDDVFQSLENDRNQGDLQASVTTSTVRYQASSVPGQLERIDPNGKVTLGQFMNGEFIESDELNSI